MIRRAENKDIPVINRLLRQVLDIHAAGRPDIFRSGVKKYTDSELEALISDERTPIFVNIREGELVGYAFCIYRETRDNNILKDSKVLYIDDLCVDETCRGKHIGRELYDFVLTQARKAACDRVELNVWTLNTAAMGFYERCGMTPQKIMMEIQIDKEGDK